MGVEIGIIRADARGPENGLRACRRVRTRRNSELLECRRSFIPVPTRLSRLTIYGAVGIVLGLVFLSYLLLQSPFQTQVGVVRPQPVPFSHEHHVSGLGIDCRYCHTSVETSSFAGLPPTHTCMTCHSQIWATSPMLEPVRTSLAENKPLVWTRVHDLPDFVYFNHAIHVKRAWAACRVTAGSTRCP